MVTIDTLRQQVRTQLIAYLKIQPRIKQLPRIPRPSELDDHVSLRDLRFDHRDNQCFGRLLTMRGMCNSLPLTVTMPWRTVGDIVESVIRHPLPPKD